MFQFIGIHGDACRHIVSTTNERVVFKHVDYIRTMCLVSIDIDWIGKLVGSKSMHKPCLFFKSWGGLKIMFFWQ